jgi:hypothetical protein
MGMKSIQTVYIGDLNTVMSQHGSNGEKPHGFGPEIVSSEIMDPGVNQKNMRCIADRHYLFYPAIDRIHSFDPPTADYS